MATVAAAMARRTVTTGAAWALGATTSAPMVVLVGGIVATYAGSEATALPLLFVLVGAVVTLLLVGYAAMVRAVPHSAPYYAITARGIGPKSGVAAGFVALLAYNALQISLYGLFGAIMSGITGFGAWWFWAAVAIAVVTVLGTRRIVLSTQIVMGVLILSFVVVGLFVVVGFLAPSADGIPTAAFDPAGLSVPGLGLAVALTLAAYTGPEGMAAFIEEEDSGTGRHGQAISRGMMWCALTLIVVYTAAAWALEAVTGAAEVAAAAGNDPNLPLTILSDKIHPAVGILGTVVLVLAILTSVISFHNIINRYAFAMSREQVLPQFLYKTGSGTAADAPVGASRAQNALAAVVVLGFALAGADPQAVLFGWASTLGAMGLLTLLIIAGAAALRYFARNPGSGEKGLVTTAAPLFGVAFGIAILVTMLLKLDELLGTSSSSLLPYGVPALLIVAALAGAGRASALKRSKPQIFDGISHGVPSVYAVPDRIDL
ncbi:APC family permease [Actinoplanes derwentensis]|uniref:Amino acid transporter n=1 Tax=Actinoplanes derwentensis TaxID=113562 RepID=A0A1H1ZFW0_9ACTN|nr:APC family permease [Actinoplanes derwentensis]GID82420.1 amino acid permease [Actinoplanes derwentensis]SDT32598.1 Amino acid transporter [Actinoplanes derwentensis]